MSQASLVISKDYFPNWVHYKQGKSRDEFVAAHPNPVLLRWLNNVEATVFFRTQTMTASRLWTQEPLGKQLQRAQVIPVVKAPGNPFPERMTLGRAPNCDVVIREPYVSKIHGHFAFDGASGRTTFTDAKSANGSRLNQDVIPAGGTVFLSSSDMLTVGGPRVLFFEAAEFYSLL